MMKARGIAVAPSRKARIVFVAGLAGIVLAACGGGAQTVDNPLPQNPGGPTQVTYNGINGPRDTDVNAFKNSFWTPMQNAATCGNCHNETTAETPMFARFDDINMAYDEAVTVTDRAVPVLSRLVSKVGGGHNCWLSDDQACADIMTTWIENWVGSTASEDGRQIILTAPALREPGRSRNYADADPENFRNLVYTPYLERYCSGCHSSTSPLKQQPYFAETGALNAYLTAYEAAKPKMNLDDPAASQFVVRMLEEGHNLIDWPGISKEQAASELQAAIQAFANTVPLTQLDAALVNSKALSLVDGIVASGGDRYEAAQIGLWEFKTGTGRTAFDTSGVTPALDLTLSGAHEWFGGWGVTIKSGDPALNIPDGRAQGSTSASRKLFDRIRATGEYSIEAWVVPNNVTQEMARIVSYSAGDTARNFTLQQTLYNYDFRHRSTETGANGDPQLSTPDADEVLQATLQHVVATYSATDGRSISVNGQPVTQPDPTAPGTLIDWDDTFAFVLGNEAGGNGLWRGTLRMVAVHEFALTQEQIRQNFEVGVGEKFFLLFHVGEILDPNNPDELYILFEVSQFDSYSYLFAEPHFIALDESQPDNISIRGMRIGINGAEVDKSQSYANLADTLSYTQFGELGQPLSGLGAIIPLEKGPADDEFFLTFDDFGGQTYVRTDDPPLVITESDLPPAQRYGVRTFDEINATMSAVTGVSPEDSNVDMTFQNLRQSLPATEAPQAFLSSHQVAIAQLAIEYCNALIEDRGTISSAAYFPGFNFGAEPATAFANRDALITPLVDNMMGIAIQTQPDFVTIRDELGYSPVNGSYPGDLIDRLIAGGTSTRSIAKGTCAAVLGSAVTLVQ